MEWVCALYGPIGGQDRIAASRRYDLRVYTFAQDRIAASGRYNDHRNPFAVRPALARLMMRRVSVVATPLAVRPASRGDSIQEKATRRLGCGRAVASCPAGGESFCSSRRTSWRVKGIAEPVRAWAALRPAPDTKSGVRSSNLFGRANCVQNRELGPGRFGDLR
jgi:hypothetical protein